MSHPLEHVIREAQGFLLIGDSAAERFPAMSYSAYTQASKRFYCIDLGGLTESRGPMKTGKVYNSVDELPDDRGDLAIIWVKPQRAVEAVECAVSAGCSRVWFSFHSGHPDGVARARELGMEIVEVGRCPVYYLDVVPLVCKMHTALVSLTGTRARPPQLEADHGKRELA